MVKMEDCMSSTNYKVKEFLSVAEAEFSSEDSSWSLYTEDFITSRNEEDSAVCSGVESSYMFPDAVCSVKKMCANDDHAAPARLISKRRKTRATFVDRDLEDTATSPVCSSKVQDMDHFYIPLPETDYGLNTLPQKQLSQHEYKTFSQDRKTTSDKTEEAIHFGFIGNDIKYTGLKNKGLCLVPVSMLFNVC